MLDLLKKTLLTGIGIAALTKEKIEEVAKKIAKDSKLSEKEGKKLVKDLLEKSDEARKNLEKQVTELVKNAMKKLSIPTREDLQKLEKQVKKLENLIQK
ncbi:MAG: phasin family protein [Candidatus Cloacimonetes bacterium]|nr:phasin family protein [Candidatus Cloacimonadota bacterium]